MEIVQLFILNIFLLNIFLSKNKIAEEQEILRIRVDENTPKESFDLMVIPTN